MPTKRNKAGNQQNYVPKGNGDASGEYGDNETGSNKHFTTFARGGGENKVDNADKKFNEVKDKKVVIRKVYDDTGRATYYNDADWENFKKMIEQNPDLAERKKKEGWRWEEKEISYDESKIQKDYEDYIQKRVDEGTYTSSWGAYQDYEKTLSEDEKDAFFTTYKENKQEFEDFVEKAKENKKERKRQESIQKGKEYLDKLPKIKGKMSVNENIELVNKANFDRTKNDYWNNKQEYNKYHENCQKCVQAFELRMRGYDVIAKERPHGSSKEYSQLYDAGWDLAMFQESKNGFEIYGNNWLFGGKRTNGISTKELKNKRVESQKTDIENIVSKAGDGARFQCTVAWKGGSAHVFNVINDNGKVRFIDAQNGNLDCSDYFTTGRIKPSETMLVRTDNLDIGQYVELVAKGMEK